VGRSCISWLPARLAGFAGGGKAVVQGARAVPGPVEDLCIMAHRWPNHPPGACAGQRLPAPRQALWTPQPAGVYGLYGKTIANLDRHEKRPPRQAAARLGHYAEVFECKRFHW